MLGYILFVLGMGYLTGFDIQIFNTETYAAPPVSVAACLFSCMCMGGQLIAYIVKHKFADKFSLCRDVLPVRSRGTAY